MLEYVRAVGSNIPIFEFVKGVMTIFPLGKRTPPAKPPPPVPRTAMFAKVCGGFPDGFKTTTFAAVYGTHTTFPFGAKTPPKNPDVIVVLVNVSAVGLY